MIKPGLEIQCRQCKECLFGKKPIVSPERKQEVIAQCVKEKKYFICHMSTRNKACYGYFKYWLKFILPRLFELKPPFERMKKAKKAKKIKVDLG
jgi:hypothetical protein